MTDRLRCRASVDAGRAGSYQCWNTARATRTASGEAGVLYLRPVCGVHARAREIHWWIPNRWMGEAPAEEHLP